MSQHDTFRHAGRARGVDDGSEVFSLDPASAAVEFRIALLAALVHEMRHAEGMRGLDRIHYYQLLDPGLWLDGLHLAQLRVGGNEHHSAFGILEDETCLLGSQRRINRHRHDAKKLTREVSDRPFRAIFGENRYSVSPVDGPALQGASNARDVAVQFS